jgi:hypothetical protein
VWFSGIVMIIKLPLLDLNDLKKVLSIYIGAGKEEFQAEYGRIFTHLLGRSCANW